MAWWVAVVTLVTAAVGCGGPSPAPDAPPPIDVPPFVPGPNVVTLTFYGETPIYVRYQDGTGPAWTEPVDTRSGTYELHVTDAYQVVAVCGNDSEGFDTEVLYRTFDDGSEVGLYCYAPFAFAPLTVPVIGQMQQAGTVFFSDIASSPTGPWTFNLDVYKGTNDLIAVGTVAMAIRRDEVVDVPRTLATIDLAQEGQPLSFQTFDVTANVGERLSSATYLFTQHGFAFIDSVPSRVPLPPPSVLQPGDEVEVSIVAESDDHYRTVSGPAESVQISSELLAPLAIQFSFSTSQLYASWQQLPDAYDRLILTLYGSEAGYIDATKRWVDVTGTPRISLANMPYDYDNRWAGGLGGGYFCDIYALQLDGDIVRRTGVTRSM